MLKVRRADEHDLPGVLSLVAGMFADLGSAQIHESWAGDVTQAITADHARVGVFVVLDADRLVATAVGLVLTALLAQADAAGLVDWTVSVDSTTARVHQHAATLSREVVATLPSHTGGWVELQGSAL